jgi:hypothetical protein
MTRPLHPPKIGENYRSTTHPDFIVHIVSVEPHPTDRFLVIAIDKSEGAEGGEKQVIEFCGDEWEYGKFTRADHPVTNNKAAAPMQTILPQLPEVGKIYAPKDFPDAYMKVKEVYAYVRLTESSREEGFMVSCCDPDDPDETLDVDILMNEWQDQQFTQVAA